MFCISWAYAQIDKAFFPTTLFTFELPKIKITFWVKFWVSSALWILCVVMQFNWPLMEIIFFQVIDACTACFEQRTVFTQQVLEKSLNKLVLTWAHCNHVQYFLIYSFCLVVHPVMQVDNVPIPLLFMRTLIQALDAFPALVCFRLLLIYAYWIISD
jgi:hypothetical protein